MLVIIAAVITAAVAGVALGWFLRSITSWCPQCGHGVQCASCNWRAGERIALLPGHASPVMPPASARPSGEGRRV